MSEGTEPDVYAYFAYGSNLSSARLSARVGAVRIHGPGTLAGHEHRFGKRGSDGTGKGTIVAHPYRRVHGVLYVLDAAQLDVLARHEGGYACVPVDVEGADGRIVTARTFVAPVGLGVPPPSAAYLDHYRAGFVEHALPRAYALALLRDAADERPF